MGNLGQVKFLKEYCAGCNIKPIHLVQFFSALEKEWISVMQWTVIKLPLENAELVQQEVGALMRVRQNIIEKYRYNVGQLNFVAEIAKRYNFNILNVTNFFTAFGKRVDS